MSAFGYKKCRFGRQKVRNVEAICKECFAKLPETMHRRLKDKVLYPAVYNQACKYLAKRQNETPIEDMPNMRDKAGPAHLLYFYSARQ
ncbi:MAG: hypothetical protein WBD27_01950 [Pyrinomonadaceae bacterium]